MFCKIPLALAKKTLATMEKGNEKLTRAEVEATVKQLEDETH